jgi:hypothetical protein
MGTLYTTPMASVPACRSAFVSQAGGRSHQPLIQIQKRYTAQLRGLVLSVESGVDQWTASVVDPDTRRILYTAHRLNPQSAKSAAVEYATFVASWTEEAARHLNWVECW